MKRIPVLYLKENEINPDCVLISRYFNGRLFTKVRNIKFNKFGIYILKYEK